MTATDSGKSLYVALYDYKAQEDDELELKKGDMICATVDYLENSFGEWMSGENFRGKQGKFPATYVKPVGNAAVQSAPLAMNAKFEADIARNRVMEDQELTGASEFTEPQVITKQEKALRKYLKEMSAHHYFDSLVELGVERIRDLNLVLPSDLRHIGMDEATIQRVLSVTPKAARGYRSGSPGDLAAHASSERTGVLRNKSPRKGSSNTKSVDGRGENFSGTRSPTGFQDRQTGSIERQQSIARAIVDSLTPVSGL